MAREHQRRKRPSSWLIREDARNIEASLPSNTVFIRTRRRVSIKPNDQVLLLDAKRQFTHYASVEEASTSLEEGLGTRITQILVDGWKELETNVDFDLFTSSLQFVHNLRRPKVHLRPGYRRISEDDFKTIQDAQPFVAREAYEALFRALPDPMKGKFQAELALSFSSSKPDHWHLERTLALVQFIESRILNVGRMLFEVEEGWHRLERSNQSIPGWEVVTFAGGEGNFSTDSLANQTQRFRAIESSRTHDAKGELAGAISSLREYLQSSVGAPVDSRFERIFREDRT